MSSTFDIYVGKVFNLQHLKIYVNMIKNYQDIIRRKSAKHCNETIFILRNSERTITS